MAKAKLYAYHYGVIRDRSREWDRLIAEGEAQRTAMASLLGGGDEAFIHYPLAAAYHQRACRSWGRGALSDAARDAERATVLDPFHLPYHTTRAVIEDALGLQAEAYHGLDAFLRLLDAHRAWLDAAEAWRFLSIREPEYRARRAAALEEAKRSMAVLGGSPDTITDRLLDGEEVMEPVARQELARAYGARGLIALRTHLVEQAAKDLRRAVDLDATALHLHALGAALYAQGDVAGAAEAEARSVSLAPSNTRYRWALVASLKKLGNERGAREHAEQILATEPGVAAHRARFARHFP